MNNKFYKKFARFSLLIALVLLVIGIIAILYFSFTTPFNDWSFVSDSELFGLYGNFVGGFVGTLFSLVAVLLLYNTLVAQQDTLLKQDEALKNQKTTAELEQFETTFVNLLKTQQEITSGINSHFFSLNSKFKIQSHLVNGREFFAYSKIELTNIWKVIQNTSYLGTYDENEISRIENEIDELFNPSSAKFTVDADFEAERIHNEEKLKLTAKQYEISKKIWIELREKNTLEKLETMYGLFFKKYHYVIGHYFRHLYHIINFIDQYRESKTYFQGKTKKYIDFIQAQMSSYELMLLFYNAISFPKLLKLIINNNLLENLAIEDLILKKHNCVAGINLKERKRILGFQK